MCDVRERYEWSEKILLVYDDQWIREIFLWVYIKGEKNYCLASWKSRYLRSESFHLSLFFLFFSSLDVITNLEVERGREGKRRILIIWFKLITSWNFSLLIFFHISLNFQYILLLYYIIYCSSLLYSLKNIEENLFWVDWTTKVSKNCWNPILTQSLAVYRAYDPQVGDFRPVVIPTTQVFDPFGEVSFHSGQGSRAFLPPSGSHFALTLLWPLQKI
jgi:hypothetical protein